MIDWIHLNVLKQYVIMKGDDPWIHDISRLDYSIRARLRTDQGCE